MTLPAISDVRHRRIPIGACMLVRIHEETGLNIKELRKLIGDKRKRVPFSDVDETDVSEE